MIESNDKEFLWVEVYRPQKLSDCVIPKKVLNELSTFIRKGDIPNLLFSGSAGVGKTTVARAIMNELGSDMLFVNASLNRGIDMLRNEISEFASSVSFNPGRKFVLLDEADNASHLFQPALRAFIEEYSSNCGFIMTANYPNKIIEPLRSRFVTINFLTDNEEKKELIKKAIFRCVEILKKEGIDFELEAVKQLVVQKWPDLRSVINLLQRFSVNGKIDMSVTHTTDSRISSLIKYLKDKNFTEVRKWVSENSDVDFTQFIDDFYKKCKDFVEPHSIPQVVLTLANYDYKNSFVSNKELNMLACLTEIMSEVEFK